MAIFRRGARSRESTSFEPTPGSAIDGFWTWWGAEGRDLLTTALAERDPRRFVDALSAQVAAIDPGLAWETGAGERAAHVLTVTAAGNSSLRRYAQRWLRAAPPADESWEFAPARRADPNFGGGSLCYANVNVAYDAATVAIDGQESTRLDVTVFHPSFTALDQAARRQVTYLILDALLGEDDVERWLGVIEVGTGASPQPIVVLRDAVRELAARRPSERTWTLLHGDLDGLPAIVRTQSWLRWVDRPELDLHSALTLSYKAGGGGLPTPDELQLINAREDRVVAGLDPRAELVTVVTSGGARTLHIYSDGADQDVTSAVARLAAGARARISQDIDPSWRAARF